MGWQKKLKYGSKMNEVTGKQEICGVYTSFVPLANGMSELLLLGRHSKPVLLSHIFPTQTDNCSPTSQAAQVLQSANQTNSSAKPTCNLEVGIEIDDSSKDPTTNFTMTFCSCCCSP